MDYDWKANQEAQQIINALEKERMHKKYMESTAIKQVQDPELSLSAEIEPFAKGGWKKTIRASVRVFDGDLTGMYVKLDDMLKGGLILAHQAIRDYEQAMEGKEETNE